MQPSCSTTSRTQLKNVTLLALSNSLTEELL